MNPKRLVSMIILIVVLVAFIGWGQCVYKLTKCDFKAPYKAEVFYGFGTFSGMGCIIGYMNIGELNHE